MSYKYRRQHKGGNSDDYVQFTRTAYGGSRVSKEKEVAENRPVQQRTSLGDVFGMHSDPNQPMMQQPMMQQPMMQQPMMQQPMMQQPMMQQPMNSQVDQQMRQMLAQRGMGHLVGGSKRRGVPHELQTDDTERFFFPKQGGRQ